MDPIRTRPDGTKYPLKGGGGGKKGGSGKVLAAGALAIAVAAGGGGGGAVLGGGTVGGGGAGSAVGESVSVRISNSKQAARKGNTHSVLRAMRLKHRKTRGPDKQLKCVASSFGEVQDFLARTPCRSLKRTVVRFDDEHGHTAVLSAAWARMPTGRVARELKYLDDRDGTGDFYALGNKALAAQGVSFTGEHYRGRHKGTLFTRTEVAPLNGTPDPDFLQGIADAAVYLPPPPG